jgi:hypothetical protein
MEVPGARDVAVEFFTMSKSYNMAGWRVGFMVDNRNLVHALARIKGYHDYGTFTPIQVAAIAALEGPQDCVREIALKYQKRRDVLVKGLHEAGWPVDIPKASMYVWATIPEPYRAAGSLEFAKRLLADAKVSVSPGIGFGEFGDGHVRFALIENENRVRQAVRGIREMLRRDGAPTQQPAAAARHEQIVQLARVLDQFLRRRPLARDDVRMIVGRHQDVAVPLGQLVRDRLARRDLRIVDHDLRAVVARGRELLRRRVLRHHDRRMHAQDPAHKRQRLGVVARRVGDHPARPLLIAQPADRVERTAKLERADALQVLAFEEHAIVTRRVQQPRGRDGCAMRVALDPLGGGGDVVVGDHICSQPLIQQTHKRNYRARI